MACIRGSTASSGDQDPFSSLRQGVPDQRGTNKTNKHTHIHTQTLTVALDLWIAPVQLSALPAGASSKAGVTGTLAAYLDTANTQTTLITTPPIAPSVYRSRSQWFHPNHFQIESEYTDDELKQAVMKTVRRKR